MPLEVYHLHLSQCERIVWLLEEMKVPYDLKIFKRDPKSGLSPEDLKTISKTGTSPYIRDTSVSPPIELFESGAIVEYILSVYGGRSSGNRMNRVPGDPDYTDYLSWLHYANASLQAGMGRSMTLGFAGQTDSAIGKRFSQKLHSQFQLIDDRLSTSKWLAGDECTAADCMTVFTLTTMRGFFPFNIEPFQNIRRYLNDVVDRPAYREALKKADFGMAPMIQPRTRKFVEFEAFSATLKASPDGVEV